MYPLAVSPAPGPELLASLPLLGVDGTLRRAVYERSSVAGNVRAKSGTLTGVSVESLTVTAARVDGGTIGDFWTWVAARSPNCR